MQLLELGFTAKAIEERLASGRLHRIARGVYAVGRPEVTQYGRWMAAVLTAPHGAVLSHESAGQLWEIRPRWSHRIEISVPQTASARSRDLRIHRRYRAVDAARHRNIPVTTPTQTLIDLAGRLNTDALEAAINEADKLDLVDPEALRTALDESPRFPGIGHLKRTLDRHTFVYTDTALERAFLPIARRVGLRLPQTQRYVNSFRVDFTWPELDLVVETDGLRYHRTPAQQAKDTVRDHAHAVANTTRLRFTHGQIRYDPKYVERILGAVAQRLLVAA